LLLDVVVHSASIQDRRGARTLLLQMHKKFPKLELIWADGGYTGKLVEWTKNFFNWKLEIVKRNDKLTGFHILPKRWIVERTFAWLNWFRRLSKDVEHNTKSSETVIKIAMIRLMARRLAYAA